MKKIYLLFVPILAFSILINVFRPVFAHAATAPPTLNGYQLNANEAKWVQYIADNVVPLLPANARGGPAGMAARVTWWSLREAVLDATSPENPIGYSNCGDTGGNHDVNLLYKCPTTEWQVGIGAVHVGSLGLSTVEAKAKELHPGMTIDQILGKVATEAGYSQSSNEYSGVISSNDTSTSKLRTSLVLRDPATGFFFEDPAVISECVDGNGCTGDSYTPAKELAPDHATVIKVISQLTDYFSNNAGGGNNTNCTTASGPSMDINQQLQWPLYAAGCASSSACEDNLIGSDNNEKTFNWLFSSGHGLSKEDTAAIVGNFIIESGKDPLDPAGENPSTHAYGIGQWLGERLTALQNYASKPGNSLASLGTQLNYLWDVDIPSQEPAFHVLEKLKQAPTLDEKTISWEATFERSGGALIPERIIAAHKIFAKYGSNPPPGGGTCGYSLPVDRHWYDEHKDWFTKPHHDYPAADIPVPEGAEVFSASSGTVTIISDDLCGKGINVDAGDNIVFTYCHSSDSGTIPGVKNGDKVQPGQLIMHVDSTGHVTGPHLHFGIKVGTTRVCPQNFLVDVATGKTPNIKSLPSSGCTD